MSLADRQRPLFLIQLQEALRKYIDPHSLSFPSLLALRDAYLSLGPEARLACIPHLDSHKLDSLRTMKVTNPSSKSNPYLNLQKYSEMAVLPPMPWSPSLCTLDSGLMPGVATSAPVTRPTPDVVKTGGITTAAAIVPSDFPDDIRRLHSISHIDTNLFKEAIFKCEPSLQRFCCMSADHRNRWRWSSSLPGK